MPVIGTCGNCGGAVRTPDIWGGVQIPSPQCERCSATPINAHGPILPMRVNTSPLVDMPSNHYPLGRSPKNWEDYFANQEERKWIKEIVERDLEQAKRLGEG